MMLDSKILQTIKEFSQRGYAICKSDDIVELRRIRDFVEQSFAELVQQIGLDNEEATLERAHLFLPQDKLNEVRLKIFSSLNNEPWLKLSYWKIAARFLDEIVGNELAMQNKVNLSIQLPQDETSLLPMHADTFAGESPFEVVLWTPLVDVCNTSAMFFLPKEQSRAAWHSMPKFEEAGIDALFKAVKNELVWLNMDFGDVLIFSPTCFHGNVTNVEPNARWSLNCRFKSLFSPYGSKEKGLGPFFSPFNIRPATQFGLDYKIPDEYR